MKPFPLDITPRMYQTSETVVCDIKAPEGGVSGECLVRSRVRVLWETTA